VRTAGVGREPEELQWDLDYLLQLWGAIEKAAAEREAPFLVYQESNLFIRALRDHLRNDIGEILIDNPKVYEDAREFVAQVMPHNARKLKLYSDSVPLFNRFQIESQIESAFARTVHLPSGGSVVIDHTEALLSIDINSARSTKGSDIEETAYQTNLEAADEIARQLRLRDLGGLIVIDFIDMMDRKHQRSVEDRLRHALQIDKARVQTGRISRFGLLEMSRQRLRPSLGESSQESCPRCSGHGRIRSIESLALSILRLVEEECMKDYTGQVIVQAPTTVANFLLNEKRKALAEIEARHVVPIVILSNEYMERPRFEIHRVRKSDVTDEPSYARVEEPQAELGDTTRVKGAANAPPVAAVTGITPARPVPVRAEPPPEPVAEKARQGFFGMLFKKLFVSAEADAQAPAERPAVSRQAKVSDEGKASSGAASGARKAQDTSREAQNDTSSGAKSGGGRSGGGKSARGGRRGGKKKTSSGQEDGSRNEPRKKTKRKPRKKASRKKGGDNRPDNRQQNANQNSDSGSGQNPGQQDASDGNRSDKGQRADNDGEQQKPEGSSRRSRRRRSPYQTSGAKARDDEGDQKSQAATKSSEADAKQSAASGNGPARAEKAPANPEASRSTQDAAGRSANASKPESGRPADATPGERKAVEVTQDGKGIYTLKSREAEASAPDSNRRAGEAEKKTAKSTDSA